MNEEKLFKSIYIDFEIEVKTGLHIGGSAERADIGGIDKTLVKSPNDGAPYIPGSSLKGKIRSLLEVVRGENALGDCKRNDESDVSELFGAASSDGNEDDNSIQSRVIFRDAELLYKDELRQKPSELPYLEIKAENTINRITGKAKNPRKIERVIPGAIFQGNAVIKVIAPDNDNAVEREIQHVLTLLEGFLLLEDDYLGGSGTRGYGKVKVHLKEVKQRVYRATAEEKHTRFPEKEDYVYPESVKEDSTIVGFLSEISSSLGKELANPA
mgnify:CR=1 FL=1